MKLWFMKGVWTRKNAAKKIEHLCFADIKNIAILRHAALGDMLLTRCFIIEARKLFPNAKITLSILSNYTRGVPEDLVDRIHIIHGTDQRGTSIFKRIKRIKELGHQDFIFDLAGGNRSFFTCLFTPATLKIGFPYKKIRAWLFYDIAICRGDLTFETTNMLNMLELLGAKTDYPHVYNLPGKSVKREKPYLVYFAGASVPEKCWPQKYFSELIQSMARQYPEYEHLILDGLKDWERAGKILDTIENPANINTITADTIEETTALLKGASLLVSNDTGIRHVAITSGTPTVGIFIGGPYRYWPRYDIHQAVFPQEKEVPVSVNEVLSTCTDLLSRIQQKT